MSPFRFVRRLVVCVCWIGGLVVGTAAPALAQTPERVTVRVTVKGTVTDDATGQPLPGANVFLAGTTTGTATGDDGTYRLPTLRPGAVTLVVSMLGYEPARRVLRLAPGASRTVDLRLTPRVLQADGVVVEARRDDAWYDRLDRFRDVFLGTTRNAHDTHILNANVLRFDAANGVLRASATAPLIVQNQALGYRVKYTLHAFERRPDGTSRYVGEAFFTPLSPPTDAVATDWAERRERAYEGSFVHWIRSVLQDRCRQEGFTTSKHLRVRSSQRRRPPRVSCGDLVRPSGGIFYALEFDGILQVEHRGTTAYVHLSQRPAEVDRWGALLNPEAVTVDGAWGDAGVADLLPRDYALPED